MYLNIRISSIRNLVFIASVIWLFLPIVVFVIGWIKSPISYVLALGYIIVAERLVRARWNRQITDQTTSTIGVLSLAGAIALLTAPVLVSGAGGFGYQTWDWIKHNAVLRDLIVHDWPVVYKTSEDSVALVYYLAYYLPAALAGKLFGWSAANYMLLFITWCGFVLSGLWVALLTPAPLLTVAAIFVFFSGLDILGAMLLLPIENWPAIIGEFDLEWWAGAWQYSANLSLLFYVPQQALAAWLLAALLFDDVRSGSRSLPLVLLLSISALWSPFVTIGLIILAVFLYFQPQHTVRVGFPPMASIPNLLGIAGGILFLLYFLSRFASFDLPPVYSAGGPFSERGGFRFLPLESGFFEFFSTYSVFILLEFLLLGVLGFLLFSNDTAGSWMRNKLLLVLLPLTLLPFFHFGVYNDLVMRVSIPILFVFQILIFTALFSASPGFLRAIVFLIILSGALHSANLFRIQSDRVSQRGHWIEMRSLLFTPTLLRMEVPAAIRQELMRQYLGSTNTLFFRRIAPQSQPRRVRPPRRWNKSEG